MNRIHAQPHIAIENGLERCVQCMALLVFGAVALANLLFTCDVQLLWEEVNPEYVRIVRDNVLINLLCLAVMGGALMLALRREPSPGAVWAVTAGMLAWTAFIGCWWVASTHTLPQSDSKYLCDLAVAAAGGRMDTLRDSLYLFKYPHQMGTLGMLELFCRLCGGGHILWTQYFNVLCVTLAYGGAAYLALVLSASRRAVLGTALLLLLCPQGPLLCTFIYGTLPGMCLSVWGAALLCRYLKRGSGLCLWGSVGLLTAAAVVKTNFLVAAIAAVLTLLLSCLKHKRFLPAAAAAALAALSLLAPYWVRVSYGKRCNTDFGGGIPSTYWLYTGMDESPSAPGWYGSYDLELLEEYGYHFDEMEPAILLDIRQRLEEFASRPGYALRFYGQKFVSQWCEPEFQSVWSSASAPHSQAPGPLAQSLMYGGWLSGLVYQGTNQVMQLIWVCFAVGIARLLFSRADPASLLPVLMLLGAALYHMLFEAKAQYILIWMPLAIPGAAMALCLPHLPRPLPPEDGDARRKGPPWKRAYRAPGMAPSRMDNRAHGKSGRLWEGERKTLFTVSAGKPGKRGRVPNGRKLSLPALWLDWRPGVPWRATIFLPAAPGRLTFHFAGTKL